MTATNKVKKTKNSASFKSHHSDDELKNSSKSSYDKANIFSRLYCWYIFSFLYRNYNKDIYLDAIDVVAKEDACERLGNKLRRHWNEELERKKAGKNASLTRAILWSFGPLFLLTNVYNFIVYGVLRMIMPMILGKIILYSNKYFKETVNNTLIGKSENNSIHFIQLHNFNQSITTDENGQFDLFVWLNIILSTRQSVIAYSGLLALVILVNVCISHPYFFRQFRYGMHIRVAVSRLIFEKAMRVSTNSVQRNTIGKIVNLVSNDANRFDIAYIYVGFVYCALLETTVGIYFMYQYIGLSSFGTLAIVLVYIPFQTIMANILSKFRSKSIILTDNRLRLMAEILPAMRVIKMYCWEKSFAKLVHVARKLEITKIRHSMILRSINLALYFVAPKVMAFSCILLYLLFDKNAKLSAENVFVTMALVAQIRDVITYMFPLGISYSVESYISIQRIQKFLLETEVTEKCKSLSSSEVDRNCKNPCISLKNVTVTSDEGIPILQNISFESVSGKLTVIIGAVGSGKSSILLSILNELPLNFGSIDVTGNAVYASQESWIFNGTVKENILFGKEYDSTRYREVVKMAALTKDFQQFEDSDQTMVDDRGTSLSGGQRARISLARALYTDADCYLLDDPLSAVDSSVSKHIFEKCIKEYLHNKCVILVTHQLQFIKQADQIVVLKDGGCFACGSYTDLLNQGIDVFKYSIAEQEKPETLSQYPDAPSSPPILKNPALLRFRVDSFNSDIFRTSRTNSFIESEHDGVSVHDQVSILEYLTTPDGANLDEAKKLPQNMESNESGSKNKLKIYKIYISAGAGILLFLVFMLSNVITQGLFTLSDYWLSLWTDHEEKLQIERETNVAFERSPIIAEERHYNIIIYSCIVGLLFVMSIVRTTSFFVIAMRASVNLHNKIFSSLIQAPIVFFDKTPVGVIMNRISRDLGIIDDLIPPIAFEALEILGNSLAIFILCSILNWFVVMPFVVLMILIYLASRFYVNTARKLKRLEAVARSPLFNQLACSLTGLPTIRSYRMQKLFIERFNDTQDVHTATYFAFISASRLYGIFLEILCVLYITSLIIVININLDSYTGSVIGLSISQVLAICNTFNWGVRQGAELDSLIVSVNRIVEFGELDKEELDKCKQEPDTKWPWRGEIVYKNVSLVFNTAANLDDIDEPPKKVLNNLSFHIRGGEKIGIVGRTGAGKSSLITTLFRLTQPTGQILIDNIDTADTSLSRLRKGLAIIPQEPILFSGTIRRNLDPFNEKSDEELWDAIDKVQLKNKILSFPSKLDSSVSDCGSDFSVGQKQLICLARAILRRSPILILDECTANCDPRTDSLIQQAIRNEFASNTVLTIAHRLITIIDYDRIMVLDQGRLVQFDSPYELIKQRSGIFYELYSSLNPDTKVELKRMALKAYAEKQQTQL